MRIAPGEYQVSPSQKVSRIVTVAPGGQDGPSAPGAMWKAFATLSPGAGRLSYIGCEQESGPAMARSGPRSTDRPCHLAASASDIVETPGAACPTITQCSILFSEADREHEHAAIAAHAMRTVRRLFIGSASLPPTPSPD